MVPGSGQDNESLTSRLRRGWDIARENFGDQIIFYAPSLKRYATGEIQQTSDCSFSAVSITAGRCALMCDHCRGTILNHMDATDTPDELLLRAEEIKGKGGKGLLVSGGADLDGAVPLGGFIGAIAEIKTRLGLRVLVHTGITSARMAGELAAAGVDGALIDIIGSDETAREVYHLKTAGMDDYRRSLMNLCDAGVPVSPHVVMGLHYGLVRGERDAIDMVSEFPVSSLVLVGLMPLRGTPMEGAEPPSPEAMGELILYARMRLPQVPLLLGCERPGGSHKSLTDALAIQAGVNGIAYPAEGIIAYARKLGLTTRTSDMCCALAGELMQKATVMPDGAEGS
ncbi:biotin synthase [bacterium BMS3Abin01]|nr:biotin synthase [bacterium BMS3Abin01]HDZ59335.1 radical SAM protein [Actinomycetota bacterium]